MLSPTLNSRIFARISASVIAISIACAYGLFRRVADTVGAIAVTASVGVAVVIAAVVCPSAPWGL